MKAWEDLTIADDYMFKLVMSHKRICKRLLETLLSIKIRDLKEPETEKAMKYGYEGKGIRLDVYVEDDLNTVYDIEMQIRHYSDEMLGKRTRYYQSTIDFGALESGVTYDKLKKSIIIFICPFQLFNSNRHIYTFQNTCQEDKSILLEDGASKIFLSTKGKIDDVSPQIKHFLDFVDGLSVQDEFVDEIKELMNKLKITEREKANYMTFQMKIDEEREEAKNETLFSVVKALVQKEGWSFEKAFDVLGVSPENRGLFLKNMQKTTLMN
ncbi:MAG: Rpn family recombination-promoting nuclease/putative transposase [Selenomonadaceae bacterium]|nr:Rpn family recombination-promoting nuclease/putative transposase [Selenomonadaceae bacterium]